MLRTQMWKGAKVLQPKAPRADGTAAQGSALRALHRQLVVHLSAAWNAVRLVGGARADDPAHLLTLRLKGPVELFMVEETVAHQLLDAMVADCSLLRRWHLEMAFAPMPT